MSTSFSFLFGAIFNFLQVTRFPLEKESLKASSIMGLNSKERDSLLSFSPKFYVKECI